MFSRIVSVRLGSKENTITETNTTNTLGKDVWGSTSYISGYKGESQSCKTKNDIQGLRKPQLKTDTTLYL